MVHLGEMIFGHSGLEPRNDFDTGSAMLRPLPPVYVSFAPVYVSFELAAPAKFFARRLEQIAAGYSGLGS